MAESNDNLHIYQRDIKAGERNSLTVLADLVHDGAKVLDLGTGSGALGRHLQARGCTVDGVTINAAEAALARDAYRRLELGDLDSCDLVQLFAGERYDAIICADVLEHLKRPEMVVAACSHLLAAGGRLLISIPNAAYCGLIGELLSGDFVYREEGLLDRTHLRFFTRRSLTRFMQDQGWNVLAMETVPLDLLSSEFRVAFDSLPPAVSRYLLSIPDAQTYQLIAVAQPAAMAQGFVPPPPAVPAGTQALFSAQLYIGVAGGYAEERKVSASGVIGQIRQTLRFNLPALEPLTGLRLDPADRPGFLHLHCLRLCDAAGQVLWQWQSETDGLALLEAAAHHELLLRPPWPASPAAMVLLHGDDPWLELPVPATLLGSLDLEAGVALEVELGWPMSADYLALADLVKPLVDKLSDVERDSARKLLELEQQSQQQLHQTRQQAAEQLRLTEQQAAEQLRQTEQEAAERLRRTEQLAAEQFEQAQREAAQRLEQLERAAAEQLHHLQQASSEQKEALLRQAAQEREAFAQEVARQRERFEHEVLLQQQQAQQQQLALEDQKQALAIQAEQERSQREQVSMELQSVAEQNRLLAAQNRSLFEQKIHYFKEKSHLQAERQQLQREREGLIQHLQWIENSTVFRATRPLVRVKMGLDRLLKGPPAAPLLAQPAVPKTWPAPADSEPVDIIVPVYRGLDDTRCCIDSVLRSACRTPYRLIVINDCSPEPEVTAWLRQRAQEDARITLLENPQNLGFVGTVNRGMSVSDSADVLLLNSDAEVANDWLDRLRAAAYSDARVASVTPFSNNATICSYPRFCQDNALPDGYDTARLDRLFAVANPGEVVDVPTGVGFCMYIRRDSLREVGLFDTANFGKGYGEENDFCRRADAAGWRNLHALDTFVRHAGGVSFGASKSPREREAMETLRRLHPDYEAVVMRFVHTDPPKRARQRVHLARMRASGHPVVLSVVHDRSGGTVRHVAELAKDLHPIAEFVVLRPIGGGQVSLEFPAAGEPFSLSFKLPEDHEALVQCLRDIGVGHVHFHHLIGHGEQVRALPATLGVSYDFTAHDYYMMCPQISLTDHTNGYCGEKGLDQCRACLRRSPAPGGLDIETWRSHHADFLIRARHVLAPSRDTARRLVGFTPTADVRLAPHTDLGPDAGQALPVLSPTPLDKVAPLKVVVLGALSAIKGADVLEDLAVEAARQGAPLEFHLLGYAYRSLRTQPKASLTVHGEYTEADLPKLLAWLKPDVVWFPAQWPETYSYTLSEILKAGLPVVAPDLGAFAERLNGRAWTWVRPWQTSALDWLAFFLDIRRANFVPGVAPAAQEFAPAMGLDTLIKPWSYLRDYVQGVEGVGGGATETGALPTEAFLKAFDPTRNTAALGSQQRMKQGLLMTLVRLRSARGLRSVARAIPLRWQTRLKSWLSA